MKIGISGCGIAGTAAALLLAKAGHQVHVFEQAPECQSIGSGILISPQGQRMLQRLDLLQQIAETAEPLTGIQAQTNMGRNLVRMDYQWLDKSLFGLGVHRGVLFSKLLESAVQQGVEVTNGFRVESVESDPQSTRLLGTDGSVSESFDFIIAADGTRSAIREQLEPSAKTIRYDHAALWTTAPCQHQPKRLLQVVQGTERLLGLLPIGNGHSSFFWGLPTDGLAALKQRGFPAWREQVEELFPQAASIFDTINSFQQLTFAAYQHVKMKRWCFERVIFLGDAAHACSPHLGQGVNMALEDVVCFCDALQQLGDFPAACDQYIKQRSRKLRYYQSLTRMISPFFQSNGKIRGWGRNIFLPWMPRTPYVRRQMLRTLCGFKNGWLS